MVLGGHGQRVHGLVNLVHRVFTVLHHRVRDGIHLTQAPQVSHCQERDILLALCVGILRLVLASDRRHGATALVVDRNLLFRYLVASNAVLVIFRGGNGGLGHGRVRDARREETETIATVPALACLGLRDGRGNASHSRGLDHVARV